MTQASIRHEESRGRPKTLSTLRLDFLFPGWRCSRSARAQTTLDPEAAEKITAARRLSVCVQARYSTAQDSTGGIMLYIRLLTYLQVQYIHANNGEMR